MGCLIAIGVFVVWFIIYAVLYTIGLSFGASTIIAAIIIIVIFFLYTGGFSSRGGSSSMPRELNLRELERSLENVVRTDINNCTKEKLGELVRECKNIVKTYENIRSEAEVNKSRALKFGDSEGSRMFEKRANDAEDNANAYSRKLRELEAAYSSKQ